MLYTRNISWQAKTFRREMLAHLQGISPSAMVPPNIKKKCFWQKWLYIFFCITSVSKLQPSRDVATYWLNRPQGRTAQPNPSLGGFLDILADPSPILMPTSIRPCRTYVMGLFMCYRGWITAVHICHLYSCGICVSICIGRETLLLLYAGFFFFLIWDGSWSYLIVIFQLAK